MKGARVLASKRGSGEFPAMTQKPPAAPVITLFPDGRIEAAFAPGPRGAGRRVAIALDGLVHGAETLRRAQTQLAFTLPRHLLAAGLDLLAVPGGESLLPLPVDLAALYGVSMDLPTFSGRVIEGAFAAAPFLAAELGIAFLHGGEVVAQGLASRQDVARQDGAQAVWRFHAGLRRLPRPGQMLELKPRIAGLALEGPVLRLTQQEIGVIGCLDAASPGHVEGWAADLADPSRKVKLDVLVNGARIGRIVAGEPRPDVQRFGVGDGECGFVLALPPQGEKPEKRLVSVRLAGETTELAGSPLKIDTVTGLIGCFDSLHGMCAHGWALDNQNPETPVVVEVVGPGGVVLGTAPANQFRGDLLDAGLKDGHCAFKVDLTAVFDQLLDKDIMVRIAGTNQMLAGSPQKASANRNILRFLRRRGELTAATSQRLRRALNHRAGTLGISFIMPVFNPPRAWLVEALESVRTQYCDAWEVICVDDGSTLPHVADVLRLYAARDPRFRVLRSPENVGIARAVNFGLRAARHDYVAFIDHDDRLEPDAAWQLIRAIKATDADLLYSDEAQTSENTEAITELRLRPSFSHDYYLSHPYFVHIVCARTEVARRIGGWDERMVISADVDFVLRMIEASAKIAHVPAVLYRWRTHGGSTGHAKQEEVMQATTAALQRHLDRLGTGATVREGVWYNQFRVDWPASSGKILIVIPTKNKADLLKTAVESIERHADGADYRLVVIDHQSDEKETRDYLKSIARRHVVMPYAGEFNFSRMNNLAVAQHGRDAEFILFLNNDIEATQDGFLDRLRRLANRPGVGAVGALLIYADKTVQHAGVILGFNESAEHALKFQPVWLNDQGRRNLGYNCALSSTRDYAAVTAACLMTRRAVFEEVGGFDEAFGIGFNDTDLCLRIGQQGYKILYDGSTLLYHYESATRSETKQVFHPEDTKRMLDRWGDALKQGDRFYNPHLSLRTQDHVPAEDTKCRITQQPRVTAGAAART